jgi:hypothetical protein
MEKLIVSRVSLEVRLYIIAKLGNPENNIEYSSDRRLKSP